jgi:hypothetical protein
LRSSHSRVLIIAYEAALRRTPQAYSLALWLKNAGVADAVVCDYLHIEPEGLATLRFGNPLVAGSEPRPRRLRQRHQRSPQTVVWTIGQPANSFVTRSRQLSAPGVVTTLSPPGETSPSRRNRHNERLDADRVRHLRP